MNSLNRYRPAKQFRCKPLKGRAAPFGYVEIVHSADGTHNYAPASEMVGAFAEMNAKGRKEWLKLTAGSKTTTACQSGLSAGSQKAAALSICVKTTSMANASVHSTSLSASSGK